MRNWNYFLFYYRPQRSWGKVIFSEACVKNSVHGGVVSQHALQVSRPTPREEVEGSGLGGAPGPHPGGKLRGLAWAGGLQVHTRGDPRHTPRGVSSMHWGRHPPADGYCCRRYASYWNAFLFYLYLYEEYFRWLYPNQTKIAIGSGGSRICERGLSQPPRGCDNLLFGRNCMKMKEIR